MPHGFCIACGQRLDLETVSQPTNAPPQMSTTRPIDMWFHDACPIERNMGQWKHCPACGTALQSTGPNQARCPQCDFDLPAIYRYCLKHR